MRILTLPASIRLSWPAPWVEAIGRREHGKLLVIAPSKRDAAPLLVERGVPEPRAAAWARELHAEIRPYSRVPSMLLTAGILSLTGHAVYTWQATSPGHTVYLVDPGPAVYAVATLRMGPDGLYAAPTRAA